MMKKILCSFIIVAMIICMCSFVGCAPEDDSIPALQLTYLEDFACDLEGATAIGLKKEKISDTNTASLDNDIDIFPTIYADEDDDDDERYFMYYTTESYSSTKIEYDENSIKKVSFTKSTASTDDSKKTIKQEEIEGKINRMYAGDNFVFVQYVPLVNKTGIETLIYTDEKGDKCAINLHFRPDSLVYDENGVTDFDKGAWPYNNAPSYFSNPVSQSFVISISNGKIYKIEDLCIESIINDEVVYCAPRDELGNRFDEGAAYYKLVINDKGDLEFHDIMPNKTVRVHDPSIVANLINDKYGYTYVYNDSINEIDQKYKIIYSTSYLSNDLVLYPTSDDFIACNGEFYKMDRNHITHRYVDGVLETVDESTLTVNGLIYKGHRISNGDLFTPEGRMLLDNSLYFRENSFEAWWIDSNTICALGNKKIYIKYIENLDVYLDTNTVLTLNDFECVNPDVAVKKHDYNAPESYIPIGNDYKLIPNVYDVVAINGTDHYCLEKNSEGKYTLNLLSKQSFESNNYIFQPIN